MSKDLINFIQDLYNTKDTIHLHEPFFDNLDKEALTGVIESTFVSSVGPLVGELEDKICKYTGSKFAVAVVSGTAALHTSLLLSNVRPQNEVITQSLSFVATCNAILHCGAIPVFLDVKKETMSLSPESLREFLEENCELRDDSFCWNKKSNRIIKACMPMHTFGFPAEINNIKAICDEFNIRLIEDAAESIGSFDQKKHTGITGDLGILSFNGNKIITTGGGGMILTNNEGLAKLAKHITTTAKLPHKLEFNHDMLAYNYRMPNLNAALGVSQIEKLPLFLEKKRFIADEYKNWGDKNGYSFIQERLGTKSNYWLNTMIVSDKKERDKILKETNKSQIMTRPAWTPLHELPFNISYQRDEMLNTNWLFNRIVNVPSGIPRDGI